MCGRFLLITVSRDVAERFELDEEPSLSPRYNIAPTQMVAAIRLGPHTARRKLHMLKWGLIPFWSKDGSMGARMINARADTAAQKPVFRAAFRHRRCLILADGFYEWKRDKGTKQPYLVRTADGKTFAFAGLWEAWQDPHGDLIESCAILTTDANELVLPIHDRMPVILRRTDYDLWLDPLVNRPELLEHLLCPYPAVEMTARPANPKVNKSSYDQPDCIEWPSSP
ncbi:MAG: SOS response-associated peptidase [Deltaproteobacteria bacterium]|nr:SOS response-associated peptidase [Deltaproteobacteria bacterium]